MAGHSTAAVAHAGSNPFLRVVAAISTVAGWCAAAMIVVAVVVTCQMIFVRLVLNASTVWQTETVIYLVIAATLVGLPYVQRLRGHVNVDLFPLSLAPRARFVLACITLSISILVMAMMLFYGTEFWYLAWSKGWTSRHCLGRQALDPVSVDPRWVRTAVAAARRRSLRGSHRCRQTLRSGG
ncbi:TRAP transporter small permease subunit [Labrenzia sp. ac12]